MRPIKIEFSGINSYRAPQTIDFEKLGADGLFGIFGPTGSGKSSILDAITLALYGGVDRATNNTRGIIHQLEKSLEVHFEFELGGNRYIVERRYDRNPKDPDAALAKLARLRRREADGEEVLASKPQEVTAKIEEILGIGRDEFSRAVVLPQGKFDRFLRLTGGERAAMLEHLFNLEQFGEELLGKVKQETDISNKQLAKIAGVEQGLGDCSAEAVNQAVLDFKTMNGQFTAVWKAFEAVDQSYQETESVRELFIKQKTAIEKLNQLEQKQETMATKQSRLNAAERAEPLRELIARQKDLNQKISSESEACQRKTAAHSAAVTEHQDSKKELEIIEKEYNQQLPQLQERKAQYQIAKDKQKKLKEIQLNFDVKKQEFDGLKTKVAVTAKKITECKRLFDETRVSLDVLQQERAKLIVNPEEKELIERALTALIRLEECEKRCRESKENYQNRKSQNDGRWAVLDEKVHEMLPDLMISKEDDFEKHTKSSLNQAEMELDEARKAHQQALIANAAAELVKELHDGQPCPVCGSREHPLPAKVTGEIEKLANIIKKAENRLREVRTWEGQLLKAWHDWSNNESFVSEARERAAKADREFRDALAEFEKVRGTYQRDQLRIRKQELTDFEKQLRLSNEKREALQKKQQELTDKLENLNESLQNDKIKEASVQEALNGLQAQLEEFTAEFNQITGGKDLDLLIRDLVRTFERLQQALKTAKDKEEETRTALEKLAREIVGLDATLKANQNERAAVERRLTQGLAAAGFTVAAEAESVLLGAEEKLFIRQQFEAYRQEVAVAKSEVDNLDREINNRQFDEEVFGQLKLQRETLFQTVEQVKTEVVLAENKVAELQQKQERWQALQRQKNAAEKRKGLAEELGNLLRGRKLVSFLAQEHLRDMTMEASYQLGRLTGQRYALELSKDKNCEFVIRDDYNGGNRRTVNSLSGGEIFMTSLALALALSSKIQLRGKYPLGFFFLDEGFGTLDEEKLDKVMNALEKLHDRKRMVGVISHVKELKERLPRYLEVAAAGEDGEGSRISISSS